MTALSTKSNEVKGKIYLVGAGPGNVELLTLKAYRLLQTAQVVLYDALISTEILSLLPESAEKISVGKRAGKHSVPQEQINQLLIEKAKQGQEVVRLKGGDPFIFGRGGEELQAIFEAGLTFEVIPGITAASGTAAYAGIPLTHRDHAQGVIFMTGHCQLKGQQIDWQHYAQPNNTLVIYMGILNAGLIQQGLLGAGRSPDTPVAIVSKATTAEQRHFIGTLAELSSLAASKELHMPALMIIGSVVQLASDLNWYQA